MRVQERVWPSAIDVCVQRIYSFVFAFYNLNILPLYA